MLRFTRSTQTCDRYQRSHLTLGMREMKQRDTFDIFPLESCHFNQIYDDRIPAEEIAMIW